MKKWLGLTLSLLLICLCAFALADVEINAANFPDDNFRQYVLDAGFDTDGDRILSDEELAAVTKIDCPSKSISDLKGIECFSALEELHCYDNQISSLDLSINPKLTVLDCQ